VDSNEAKTDMGEARCHGYVAGGGVTMRYTVGDICLIILGLFLIVGSAGVVGWLVAIGILALIGG
jgi:hypothetical protein